jgi:hypothetical protein
MFPVNNSNNSYNSVSTASVNTNTTNLNKVLADQNAQKVQLFSQYSTERDRIQHIYFTQIESLKSQFIYHNNIINQQYASQLDKINTQHLTIIKEFAKKK